MPVLTNTILPIPEELEQPLIDLSELVIGEMIADITNPE